MLAQQETSGSAATVTAPENWEEDWETADLSVPPALSIQTAEDLEESWESSASAAPTQSFTCQTVGCGKTFPSQKQCDQHMQQCVPQQLAFAQLDGTVPDKKVLKENLRRANLLAKLRSLVDQVVGCSAREQTGTGESAGIVDNHETLSHFLLYLVSGYLLGTVDISKLGPQLSVVEKHWPDKDWRTKPATNKLVSILNDLVKSTPRPIVGNWSTAELQAARSPVPTVSPKRASDAEAAAQKAKLAEDKAEQVALKELVKQMLTDKGFAYAICATTLQREHVEAYIALAEAIAALQTALALRPTHVDNSWMQQCAMMKAHRVVNDSTVETHTAPYPQLALDTAGLVLAKQNVEQALALFTKFKQDEYKTAKAGLDELLSTTATIGWQGLAGMHDGQLYCILPFHIVITEWLEGKKIPANVQKTFVNSVNRIKDKDDDGSFKFLLKKSGELSRIFPSA